MQVWGGIFFGREWLLVKSDAGKHIAKGNHAKWVGGVSHKES